MEKMITRYATVFEGRSIAAGVYTASDTAVLTTGPYTLTITGFTAWMWLYDTVTFQGIQAEGFARLPIGSFEDNPGMISPELSTVHEMAIQTGRVSTCELYRVIPPSQSLTVAWGVYAEAVTANGLLTQFYATVRYLIPEDYLSVEKI